MNQYKRSSLAFGQEYKCSRDIRSRMRCNQCQKYTTLELGWYFAMEQVLEHKRRHSYWRHALDLGASSAIGGILYTFLEASSAIDGMLHFWRHITYLKACLRFEGIFCNRWHAAFLEKYYLFGGTP